MKSSTKARTTDKTGKCFSRFVNKFAMSFDVFNH